jgi:chlorite dismutase
MTEQTERSSAGYFAHFLCLRADPLWRRLADEERAQGRQAFVKAVEEAAPDIITTSYSGIGFRTDADLVLWRRGDSPRAMQEMTARLLQTGIGAYLQPTHSLFGFTRPSTYTRRPTAQEQAIEEERHGEYLVVYPFTKTIDWYLMSKEARQGMMNEHMRVGHSYADVSQTLLYATGLTDAEFIVAYETNDLARFQSLVIDLRATEARRYTLRDTPVITAVHQSLGTALAMIG